MTPGRRLLEHFRDRSDYRCLVGMPAPAPTEWVEVARIDGASVTLRDSRTIPLAAVRAYLVAYPGGELVDCHRPSGNAFAAFPGRPAGRIPVPEWVRFPERSKSPDRETLTAADLEEGRSLVRVEFGKSTSKPTSRHHYSTKLTNVSGKRIRVLKFGGYTKGWRKFSLNTITSRFFTAEDFREWYGQKGDWLEPGESAVDPNNYGAPPVMWAYHCETEDGRRFVAGGILG